MLNVFKCPNCRKLIETNLNVGQTVPCPYCAQKFTIEPEDAASKGSGFDVLFRIAIPIGYVLFVGVPLALTVWYLTRRAEEQVKAPAAAPPPVAVARSEPKPHPAPRPPARPRKGTAKGAPAEPGDWTDPDPEGEPKGDGPPVETTAPVLARAPAPRELPEVFVAPEPREIVWKVPPSDFTSAWQKVGVVDLRVAGLAVTQVPLINTREQVRLTAKPVLVVVVEARMNAIPKKPRELQSWTYGQLHYATMFLATGKDLPHTDIPLGSKLHSGLPLKQPIPADGTVRDLLLFDVPPDGSGELSLRLDAERCGELGDVWVKIPAAALKK